MSKRKKITKEEIANVKKSMRQRGLTIVKIAESLGCSRATVYQLFEGNWPNSAIRKSLVLLMSGPELEAMGWKQKEGPIETTLERSRKVHQSLERLSVRTDRLEKKRQLNLL